VNEGLEDELMYKGFNPQNNPQGMYYYQAHASKTRPLDLHPQELFRTIPTIPRREWLHSSPRSKPS
jgi:hypothetical protein